MTQRQHFEVLQQFPGFELRHYPTHVVAEVEVDSSFTEAGNRAFGVLAAFISGRNSTRRKVAMTAPKASFPASVNELSSSTSATRCAG